MEGERLIFYTLTILLISGLFCNKFKRVSKLSAFITAFFLIKWVTDYRKCTFSYVEVKLRGVKKEEGYLNYLLDSIIDVNKCSDRYFWYVVYGAVLLLNTYKLGWFS